MRYCYKGNLIVLKKLVMSISSIIIFTLICWWLCCSYNFTVVSSNLHKGLYPNGPIKDFKDGSMPSLFSWVRKHSVTLVFFYAPWSGQCMKLAPEILSVFKRLDSPVVAAAAINCWVGDCRDKFPSYRFPRLFLYHSPRLPPIEYFGGIKAEAIIDFTQSAITPWSVVASPEELKTFMAKHDYYFVAYMDFQKIENDKTYNSFHHSTLLLINKLNRPQIAMVTNKTIAAILQLTQHGQIVSQPPMSIYSTELNYTAHAILQWMLKQSKKVVHVLRPDRDKDAYVRHLKKGPAIILHSSSSTLNNDLIQQYRNIALSYHGCKKTAVARVVDDVHICTSFLTDSDVCSVCQICSAHYPCVDQTLFQFINVQKQSKRHGICSSFLSTVDFNTQKYSICCIYNERNVMRPSMYSITMNKTRMLNQVSIILKYMQERYTNISSERHHEEMLSRSVQSMILEKFVVLDREAKLNCGNDSVMCPIENQLLRNTNTMIEGLACHTNRSLNFFLLDYNKNRYLLNQVSIPRDHLLLIVDLEREEHYMLTEKITQRSMSAFILQFNFGLLEQDFLLRTPEVHQQQTSSVKIVELTAMNFEVVIMSEARNVFVMFYAPWCGMCKSVNLLFLKLVHLYDKDVIFSRIDGDAHVLPWRYKASVYPSFILFPAHRKTYSISFPTNQDVTFESLKQFLNENIEK